MSTGKKNAKHKTPHLHVKPQHAEPGWLTQKNSIFAIIILTVIAFFPTLSAGFINFDDPQYLTENPAIKTLNMENVKVFFTNSFVGNYQPLSMITYALEYALADLNPFIYHFNNLLLHIVNAVFVFLIIYTLSENIFVALITALLWSLHPMKVESVAWVSERKDVLYACFFLASLWMYIRYIKKNHNVRFLILSLILFTFSILSKAQAVILPLLFFIVDFILSRSFNKKILIEKIPFFLLSLAFGLLAIKIQESSGAVQDYVYFPVVERILFSLYAFANYFYKLLIPHSLSCFYPYPETNDKINSIWVYLSPLFLIAFIVFNILFRKNKIIIGSSAIFVISILPVLQFIPVGDAIMADRYAYIPSIGIFFIIAHFANAFLKQTSKKNVIYTSCIVITVLYSGMTYARSVVWNNSISLYTDALKNYPEIPIIRNNRGAALSEIKKYEEAFNDFDTLIRIKPRYPSAYSNRAFVLEKLDKKQEALNDYIMAIKYAPENISNYVGAGKLQFALGMKTEAIKTYSQALKKDQTNKTLLFLRGEAYVSTGNYTAGLYDFNQFISIDPNLVSAYNNRGIIHIYLKQIDDAIADFSKSISLDPTQGNSYFNRSLAYREKKEFTKALEDALKAKEAGHVVSDNYIQFLQQAK